MSYCNQDSIELDTFSSVSQDGRSLRVHYVSGWGQVLVPNVCDLAQTVPEEVAEDCTSKASLSSPPSSSFVNQTSQPKDTKSFEASFRDVEQGRFASAVEESLTKTTSTGYLGNQNGKTSTLARKNVPCTSDGVRTRLFGANGQGSLTTNSTGCPFPN